MKTNATALGRSALTRQTSTPVWLADETDRDFRFRSLGSTNHLSIWLRARNPERLGLVQASMPPLAWMVAGVVPLTL
jgi:hypothetical protein